MKYKEWLDEWLEHYIRPSVKIRTYERYKVIVELHIKGNIEEYTLNNFVKVRFYLFEILGKN